jgi:hypothetical protein
MTLGLVPRSARSLAEHLNKYYRVLTGVDADSVALRLPAGGSFEVRHSVTQAPILKVTDAGLTGTIDGASVADGTISSAEIADDTIVNADVNAAANIAVSKLAHIGAGNVLRSNGSGNVGGPVVTTDMVINTINADRLQDSTITAAKLGGSLTAQGSGLIAAQVLGSASTIVTFSGIPQTFKHLQLVLSGRSDAAATAVNATLRFNLDASGLYQGESMSASGSTVSALEQAPTSTSAFIGSVPAASGGANIFNATTLIIPNYTVTRFRSLHGSCQFATNNLAGQAGIQTFGMIYYGTAPVTTIQIALSAGQWVTGSVFSLYGLN